MRIEQPFEYSGYFWAPEQEAKKVPGVLSVADGGSIRIELLGDFSDEEMPPFEIGNAPGRIVGIVDKHGAVTLQGCRYTGKSVAFGGISKTYVAASYLVVGCHFNQDEAFSFNELRFSVDGLEEWLNLDAIRVSYPAEGRSATIEFKMPLKKELVGSFNGCSMRFDFGASIPGAVQKRAQVSVQAYLRIRSETLIGIGNFIEIVYRMTQFLRFVIGEKVNINIAYVTRDDMKLRVDESSPNEEFRFVYESLPFEQKVVDVRAYKMLFLGDDLVRLSQIISRWFEMYEVIEPVFAIYFSSFADLYRFQDQRLLALVQALETLHRRTLNRERLPPSGFDALKTKILEGCPLEEREWLSRRLHYANEISLVERLRELFQPFAQVFTPPISVEKTIRKLVDTRNYLTHFDASLKSRAAKGREAWVLYQQSEAVLCLHFLRMAGLSDIEIAAVSRRHTHLKEGLTAT
jgi:hypothetical protein